jgi:hypothetical protein
LIRCREIGVGRCDKGAALRVEVELAGLHSEARECQMAGYSGVANFSAKN